MRPNFLQKSQILIVNSIIALENLILLTLEGIFFSRPIKDPSEILIYKVGNIGDIVCIVPSLIAIRKNYPKAKITLLTSPGKIGSVGAKELLDGVWYLDDIRIYHSEDIGFLSKKRALISELRKKKWDLFIQIPDVWASFATMLRNLFFAKMIGARSAFGFKIRDLVHFFKKVRVDFTDAENEVESVLDLLRDNGIAVSKKPEFDFNIPAEAKDRVERFIGDWMASGEKIIAICPGGKTEGQRWMPERFAEVVRYLNEKYSANFIILGGREDVAAAEIIESAVPREKIRTLIGKISLLENLVALKCVDFLITNDTGIMHMAAAVNESVVALFSVRNIFGRWFPYGAGHENIFHRFINCDYKSIGCFKKSLEAITVEEVKVACDRLIKSQ